MKPEAGLTQGLIASSRVKSGERAACTQPIVKMAVLTRRCRSSSCFLRIHETHSRSAGQDQPSRLETSYHEISPESALFGRLFSMVLMNITKARMKRITARTMRAMPSIEAFRSGPRHTRSPNAWVLSEPMRYANGFPQEAGSPSSEILSVSRSRAAPSTKHAVAPSITLIICGLSCPVSVYI